MSSVGRQSIAKMYPHLRKQIMDVRTDVFGSLPQLNNERKSHQRSTKQLKAVYHNQYYRQDAMKVAKLQMPDFTTDQEDRRLHKLIQLRRKGKGPPKKGSGPKKKKR